MNWEETIKYIRSDNNYNELVEESYLSEDLVDNVERYRISEEFKAILSIIREVKPEKKLKILDLGAGNGISTVAFALNGYHVTALEPDLSDTIGVGAIEYLKKTYNLPSIKILKCYAEDIPDGLDKFDIVFARQAMHHAYHLQNFLIAIYDILKPNGLLFTVRDHVIDNDRQKNIFLKRHPLHHYYGGENAFKLTEYINSMNNAGFLIKKIYKPSESIINLYPWTSSKLIRRIRFIKYFSPLQNFFFWVLSLYLNSMPGRLYSFLAQKR